MTQTGTSSPSTHSNQSTDLNNIAQAYLESTKSNSDVHTSSTSESDRRRDFNVWLSGYRSCLRLMSGSGSVSNLNSNEIFNIVQKGQKAA